MVHMKPKGDIFPAQSLSLLNVLFRIFEIYFKIGWVEGRTIISIITWEGYYWWCL
jgi:hypothetical protein